MNASDKDKLAQAFRILATVTFPDGYVQELEMAALNAHLDATKAMRAAHLLATRGPDDAAAMIGCCRSQVYVLAAQAQKVQKLDDSQTQAA